MITADHGNAEEMFQRDRKRGEYKRKKDGSFEVSTAHSVNPVPLVVVDPHESWDLVDLPNAGIAHLGPTLLQLAGFDPPKTMLSPLLQRKENPQ